MGSITASSIFVSLKIDRVPIAIKLDTGSAVTILSTVAWRKIFEPQPRLGCDVTLGARLRCVE